GRQRRDLPGRLPRGARRLRRMTDRDGLDLFHLPRVPTMSLATPATTDPEAEAPYGGGLVRQTLEFLIVLSLCVLVFRTFAAEAYIVPTGSMAPTLLGNHRELTCPNC